ncbi:hypothetical protein NMG60_11023898 [Bertholletia excelsa]
MDLWIAIAAAGAGYMAKNIQKLMRDKDSSSEFSSVDSKPVKHELTPVIGHLNETSCPFRKLTQRRVRKDVTREREQTVENASAADMASTSRFEGEILVNNVLSISSLSPGLLSNDLQTASEQLRVNDNMDETTGQSFSETSTTETGTSYGFSRNRSSLQSIRSNMHFIRPLTSLESCLMAQLYKEHAGLEECVLSSVPLPSSPIVRPFVVTDGNRIINSARGDLFGLENTLGGSKLHKKTCSMEKNTVFGVPALPNVQCLDLSRMKTKKGKGLGAKSMTSNKMVNGKHLHSLPGSSHEALLFCLGVSLGIVSSCLANKREVDKLNDLLKQTENLVQDLQDELEMRDLLTVKELAYENYDSPSGCFCSYSKRAPHSFTSKQNLNASTTYDCHGLPDKKAEEDSESMSKIEAELEAELERLEINMNSRTIEGRLLDLVEDDPNFLPGITDGELRPEMFGRQGGAQPYADQDGSGSSTSHHSANYTVSPWELSLRLHQVIQSRLEERIMELETALVNSQKKVRLMESECNSFQKDPSDGELRQSSYEPVVINLSGEALDAYNEAYDELMKTDELENADLRREKKYQNGEVECTTINGKASPVLIHHGLRALDEHVLSDDTGISGDESDEGHDEMEQMLIKHIVEKTRQGSSVILNAKKALFLAEENEH